MALAREIHVTDPFVQVLRCRASAVVKRHHDTMLRFSQAAQALQPLLPQQSLSIGHREAKEVKDVMMNILRLTASKPLRHPAATFQMSVRIRMPFNRWNFR